MIEKLDNLSTQLQREPNYPTLREYARLLIDLAKEVGACDSEARQLKLQHDVEYDTRVRELSETMAVNKSQAQASIELIDKKESYKLAEANYEKMKLLYRSYEGFLITIRQELKSQEQANIAVNEFKDDDSDLPF